MKNQFKTISEKVVTLNAKEAKQVVGGAFIRNVRFKKKNTTGIKA